jgi:hypothetical protein
MPQIEGNSRQENEHEEAFHPSCPCCSSLLSYRHSSGICSMARPSMFGTQSMHNRTKKVMARTRLFPIITTRCRPVLERQTGSARPRSDKNLLLVSAGAVFVSEAR